MELAHDRTGSGPALVLLHGITENRNAWDPLFAPLAEHFDVLAVDLRGHGASPKGDTNPMDVAGDVRDTVTASGLIDDPEDRTGPIVIGHSYGGVIATFYAAAFPTRGVINVDQGLRLAEFKSSLTMLEPMLRGDEASFRQAIDLIFSSMSGALDASEAERIRSLRRPDQDVVLGIWSGVLDYPVDQLQSQIEQLLAAITAPYLTIFGSDPGDDYVTWMKQHVPTSSIEVWPDLGHYPHLVDQGRFVARVLEFARSL